MKYSTSGDKHFIFVEKGEKIMETITNYCKENKIDNAAVTGIGAVESTTIGAFDPASKDYIKVDFPDVLELVSFIGNITLKDGEPFVHAHAVLGDHGMQVIGGHVFEMTVAVVGEFVLQKSETKIRRELNAEIGLATWCTDL